MVFRSVGINRPGFSHFWRCEQRSEAQEFLIARLSIERNLKRMPSFGDALLLE
jgi:hypothetical protein